MSADAELAVQTFLLAHPDVKGSARRLLEVIAQHIPEGDTMTPEITIPDLATLMGYGENAARRGRRDLMKVGVVRIVDGGQGQVSRYELMLLPDARGDDPALPLIGATPPAAPPRVRRPQPSTEPTLFDTVVDIRASNLDQNDRSWRRYFDHFDRSTRSVLRSFWAMFRNFDHFDRSTPLPQGVPLVSRPAATTKYVDLDLRKDLGAKLGGDARARDVDAVLAWWTTTFPTYNRGAFNAVNLQRDGRRVRELFAPGRTLEFVQAMALELWATTTDGVRNSDRWWIAEQVKVRTIAVLCWKADYLDAVVRARAPAAVNVWTRVLERIESQVNRHQFHSWFLDSVLIADRGTVIDVDVGDTSTDTSRSQWIQKFHGDVVRAAVDEVRPGTRVEFVVVDAQRRKSG